VGDEEAQRALRFATYHLIAAVNPANEHISIGARGLTGEAYRVHVFWDTEIYMLPFYVFTDPPAARALLMYRYHTLDAARRKARAHGCEVPSGANLQVAAITRNFAGDLQGETLKVERTTPPLARYSIRQARWNDR
jgi:trehalose/maltose hydrolase-like predicted phosphorylase